MINGRGRSPRVSSVVIDDNLRFKDAFRPVWCQCKIAFFHNIILVGRLLPLDVRLTLKQLGSLRDFYYYYFILWRGKCCGTVTSLGRARRRQQRMLRRRRRKMTVICCLTCRALTLSPHQKGRTICLRPPLVQYSISKPDFKGAKSLARKHYLFKRRKRISLVHM